MTLYRRLRDAFNSRGQLIARLNDDIDFYRREHAHALKDALHYTLMFREENKANADLRYLLANARAECEKWKALAQESVRADELQPTELRAAA